MSDETVYVYVGIWQGLRVAVMVDRPEYKKETGKELNRWVRDGYTVIRETLNTFHKKGLSDSKKIDAATKKNDESKMQFAIPERSRRRRESSDERNQL